MLIDHCYAFGLLQYLSGLKKKFFEEGDPHDLFLPRPGSAPGRIWPENNNTCKDLEYFIHTNTLLNWLYGGFLFMNTCRLFIKMIESESLYGNLNLALISPCNVILSF